MGNRRLWPLAGTMLLVGCIGHQAPMPSAIQVDPSTSPLTLPEDQPPPSAPVSLPPLDSPGDSPYQAPDFSSVPLDFEAGRWERLEVEPQPTAPPTPTPVPTPTRLPGESDEYTPLHISLYSQSMTFRVGQTIQLRASADSTVPTGPIGWGVLEPERASITSEGKLTALAPGPVHVYAEQHGKRRYILIAVPDSTLDATPLTGPYGWWEVGAYGSWGTLMRSKQDWERFWAEHPNPPASPPEVDFERQTIVVARISTANDGERTPVVTRIRQEEQTIVEVVTPDSAPQICHCDPRQIVSLTVVPRLPDDAQIELVRLRTQDVLLLVPVTGPTPTPSPSPTPTPDPILTLPSGAPTRPPAPPYPPPSLSGDPDACPPFSIHDGMAPKPPFSLTWYEHPRSTPWEPLLTPGASLKLIARGTTSDLRWSSLDPRMATVTQDGRITALRPGVVRIQATGSGKRVTAMIPSVDSPPPALRFRFRADWSAPKPSAPRGTRILRSEDDWAAFWQSNFVYDLPWRPPTVDFERFDVVVLVDDRRTWGGGTPVLTHVSDSGRVAHLVFGGIANLSGGGGYHQATFMFLTGKLAPDATVRVHTLCDP